MPPHWLRNIARGIELLSRRLDTVLAIIGV